MNKQAKEGSAKYSHTGTGTLLSSPFSGELTRDYCVTSYRKKMTDTREYPQYFVKKG
jgi:hypothetical protein